MRMTVFDADCWSETGSTSTPRLSGVESNRSNSQRRGTRSFDARSHDHSRGLWDCTRRGIRMRGVKRALSVGLDRLADPALAPLVRELQGSRVALVAHPASVTRTLVHALDVFASLGITPRVLFGPEHGWTGQAQDMIGVGDDANAGTRIVSLYGADYEDLSPKREHLEGIDVVVIDLQDVGSRYYTFVWTAVLVARACRDAGVRVVVLDRPNPIGGAAI